MHGITHDVDAYGWVLKRREKLLSMTVVLLHPSSALCPNLTCRLSCGQRELLSYLPRKQKEKEYPCPPSTVRTKAWAALLEDIISHCRTFLSYILISPYVQQPYKPAVSRQLHCTCTVDATTAIDVAIVSYIILVRLQLNLWWCTHLSQKLLRSVVTIHNIKYYASGQSLHRGGYCRLISWQLKHTDIKTTNLDLFYE